MANIRKAIIATENLDKETTIIFQGMHVHFADTPEHRDGWIKVEFMYKVADVARD